MSLPDHLEYDTDTLKQEYLRDLASDRAIAMPSNYFPDDDPERLPGNGWRAHGHLFFDNWLGEVARAAWYDETSDLSVEWLLTEHPMPEGALTCDFLVVGADCTETVPGMMRRLAGLGLSPEALRVHRRGDGTALVELRLGRMPQATVEAVSRELFKVPGTRRVTYRGADGSGGTLVGAPEASAA